MTIALGIGELAFRTRDAGAFPHLRCYMADPVLGLRLEPGRVEKIRFGGAAVSTVRINRDGLRGGELGPATPDEILVVGDSQAFGLGVEEDQTFAAALAAKLGRSVVNAGIPTYGPQEYAQWVEQRLDARPARTVVVLIAFQNDFFEANRPNVERHASWDGWAVRKESAPTSVPHFPGRALLYRDSHLFYALRRALHEEAGAGVTRVASGGTLADFLPLEQQVAAAHASHSSERDALGLQVRNLAADTERTTDPDTLMRVLAPREIGSDRDYVAKRALLRASTAHPGDIVEEGLGEGEEALSITATVRVIAEGAKLRDELARRWWEQNGAAVQQSREKTLELQDQLAKLRVAANPIAPWIQRMAERCKKTGTRLVIAGLPTDTMVSPDAFAKYGEPAVDTTPIASLADDLRLATEAAGATWIDLLPTLQPLGLAGFLPKEFHLSVAGHAQIAEQLANVLPRVELPRPSEAPPFAPFADFVCEGCSADVAPSARVDERGVLHVQRLMLAGEVVPPNVAFTLRGQLVELRAGEQLDGFDYQGNWTLRRTADGVYRFESKKSNRAELPALDEGSCRAEAAALASLQRSASERGTTSAGKRGPQGADEELVLGSGCLAALPVNVLPTGYESGEVKRRRGTELDSDTPETHRAVARALECAAGYPIAVTPCKPAEVRVGPAALCRALCDAAHPCEADHRCVEFRGASVCAPLLEPNPTCFQPPSDAAATVP